jgi:hypothetical protein
LYGWAQALTDVDQRIDSTDLAEEAVAELILAAGAEYMHRV